MVMTRNGAITLKGTPTDLDGPELKVGDAAPDFLLQNNALEVVSRSSFMAKTLIIATVPSLDTPVCHAETKKFNEQASIWRMLKCLSSVPTCRSDKNDGAGARLWKTLPR